MSLPVIARRPSDRPENDRDDIVVLRCIPWALYEAFCAAREGAGGVRVAYLDGEMELMSPSRPHEHWKTLLARLLEAYAEEQGLSLNGFGNETLKKKPKKSGIEPDECYHLGPEKEFPDLAIEVVYTSGGIDKLEIYRRLGVGEVWFWIEDGIRIYRLKGSRYEELAASPLFPDLDVSRLCAVVRETARDHQTEAVRAFRRSLQAPARPRRKPSR